MASRGTRFRFCDIESARKDLDGFVALAPGFFQGGQGQLPFHDPINWTAVPEQGNPAGDIEFSQLELVPFDVQPAKTQSGAILLESDAIPGG